MRCLLLVLLCAALCVHDSSSLCNRNMSNKTMPLRFPMSHTCQLPDPSFICTNLTYSLLYSNFSAVYKDVSQCSIAIINAEKNIQMNNTKQQIQMKNTKQQKASERVNCYFNVCVSAIQGLGNDTIYAGINCAIAFAKVIYKEEANAALLFRMLYQLCTANHTDGQCIERIVNQCFTYGRTQGFLFRCMHVLSRICSSVPDTEDRFECVNAVRTMVRSQLVARCNQSEYMERCMNAVGNLIMTASKNSNVTIQDITLTVSMIKGLAQNPKSRKMSLHLLGNTFNKLGDKVEDMLDESDANELMGLFDYIVDDENVMYHAMDVEFGTMVLACLERMVKACGRALLLPNGTLEPTFNFSTPNLRLSLYLSNSSDEYYQSPTASGATIGIPTKQLCQGSEEGMKNYTHGCKKYPVDLNCTTVVGTVVLNNIGLYLTGISNQSSNSSNYTVISKVISSQIINERNDSNSSEHDGTFLIKFDIPDLSNLFKLYPNGTIACMFWDLNISNWSDEGVAVHNMTDSTVWCNSTHLTSFAVLLDHQNIINETSPAERLALNTIAYIGSTLSFVSLVVTVIFLAAFRKKLNRGPLLYVHLNFAISLALALFLLLIGVGTASGIDWLCSVIAGLLHYLFLCVFCWMLAEAVMLYLLLVKVFGGGADKWYYLLPLGWGLPIPIVAITAIAKHKGYGVSMSHCWLSTDDGVIWAFIGPVIAIICLNSVMLVIAMFQILRMRAKGGAENSVKKIDLAITAIKGAAVLLPILGVTWIIGVFAVDANTTVFIWIFTIINSLQGVAILIVHVLRTKIVIGWFCSCVVEPVTSYFTRSSTVSPIESSSSKTESLLSRKISNSQEDSPTQLSQSTKTF